MKEDSILHKMKWHRVILDEAHNIKDRASNTAKAAFGLRAKFRWCLSGELSSSIRKRQELTSFGARRYSSSKPSRRALLAHSLRRSRAPRLLLLQEVRLQVAPLALQQGSLHGEFSSGSSPRA